MIVWSGGFSKASAIAGKRLLKGFLLRENKLPRFSHWHEQLCAGRAHGRAIDDRIRQKSQGKKDLRDALRVVLLKTQNEHRPFKIEELAPLFQRATGIDVSDIFQLWLQPPGR